MRGRATRCNPQRFVAGSDRVFIDIHSLHVVSQLDLQFRNPPKRMALADKRFDVVGGDEQYFIRGTEGLFIAITGLFVSG